MKELFDKVSLQCSRITTKAYSTSFSIGILCLQKSLRDPIYSIYGFVRLADEIVDSFHNYHKEDLLSAFRHDTYSAIEQKISLNPILNSFQHTVVEYNIERELIDQFLHSMEMDLVQKTHSSESFDEYVFGSAEAVGLMCLRVFCKNDSSTYDRLRPFAMRLGAAFQKVNFLRDLKADYVGMGRSYFPGIELSRFDEVTKQQVERSILRDFDEAYQGIKQLPPGSRFGVYVAYIYYLSLFEKIRRTPSNKVLTSRIRVRNREKVRLLAYSFVKHQLNLL